MLIDCMATDIHENRRAEKAREYIPVTPDEIYDA